MARCHLRLGSRVWKVKQFMRSRAESSPFSGSLCGGATAFECVDNQWIEMRLERPVPNSLESNADALRHGRLRQVILPDDPWLIHDQIDGAEDQGSPRFKLLSEYGKLMRRLDQILDCDWGIGSVSKRSWSVESSNAAAVRNQQDGNWWVTEELCLQNSQREILLQTGLGVSLAKRSHRWLRWILQFLF